VESGELIPGTRDFTDATQESLQTRDVVGGKKEGLKKHQEEHSAAGPCSFFISERVVTGVKNLERIEGFQGRGQQVSS